MKMLKPLIVALGLMSGVAFAEGCDELASSPNDPQKPAHIQGVKLDNINAPLAISVCTAELAKQPNNARLQYQLGRAYYKAEQYDKAVEWCTKSANQGNANGQFALGIMYDKGNGVTKDYVKAVEWYTKSANQGNAMAQNNLGGMYCDSNGVTKDYVKAVEWYTKSANQGDAMAQNNLGIMYENGWGVKKNKKLAKQWFGKACDNGDKDACQYR